MIAGMMLGYPAAVAAIGIKKQASSSASASAASASLSQQKHVAELLSTDAPLEDGDKPMWLVGLRPPSASAATATSGSSGSGRGGMVDTMGEQSGVGGGPGVVIGEDTALGFGPTHRPLSSGRRRVADTTTTTTGPTTQLPQTQSRPTSQPNYEGASSSSSGGYVPSSMTNSISNANAHHTPSRKMSSVEPTQFSTSSSSSSTNVLRGMNNVDSDDPRITANTTTGTSLSASRSSRRLRPRGENDGSVDGLNVTQVSICLLCHIP